jgi:hypothetical protein
MLVFMQLKPFSPASGIDLDLKGQLSLSLPDRIQVSFEWNPQTAFRASGALDDALWKGTCLEAFLQLKGEAYLELNLALDGRWNLYHFDSYRRPQPPQILEGAGLMDFRCVPGRCDASLRLPTTLLAQIQRAGLTAVIEPESGPILYYALHHAGDEPDFHDSRSFVLQISDDRGQLGP